MKAIYIVAQSDSPEEVRGWLASVSNVEKSAALHNWSHWGRPEQIPPEWKWISWGGVTGRGWGKTRACAEFVNSEVRAGRATRIALIAQNEDKAYEVLVNGESGLIATSPPWFKAKTVCNEVVWPNGSRATVYTPERPKTLYGPEHDLAWLSEIHAWPRTSMLETYSALRMGLRIGLARMIWDSNPRRKHPILRQLLERSALDPIKHPTFRGATVENIINLNAEAVAEWEAEYGGTMIGREMLLGEQLEDEDSALFRQSWIDKARRHAPPEVRRRIIAIDPSISQRRGTDATGIAIMSVGTDGQIYLENDLSGKYSWEEWAALVVSQYFRLRCDAVVVERNRGGDACVANLRAKLQTIPGASIVSVDNKAVTRHVPNVMYAKEVIGRTGKLNRAEPVASLVEQGRISHVIGGSFAELEDQLTTFEDAPGVQSPNNYDAYVWGAWELAGIGTDKKDRTADVSSAASMLKFIPQVKRVML